MHTLSCLCCRHLGTVGDCALQGNGKRKLHGACITSKSTVMTSVVWIYVRMSLGAYMADFLKVILVAICKGFVLHCWLLERAHTQRSRTPSPRPGHSPIARPRDACWWLKPRATEMSPNLIGVARPRQPAPDVRFRSRDAEHCSRIILPSSCISATNLLPRSAPPDSQETL